MECWSTQLSTTPPPLTAHYTTLTMRIAFHVPRASHLKPGFSGDKVLVRGLIEGLRARGHELQVVSHMNARDVWRGRVGRRELLAEFRSVRKEMKRFSPNAWLVYGASATNPDLFGWRRNPCRYVLLATDLGSGKRVPPNWRRLFAGVHRSSLQRADWVAAYHPDSRDDLVASGIPEQRVVLLPPAVRLWKERPGMLEARRRLNLPPDRPVLFCAGRFSHGADGGEGKVGMILDLLSAVSSLPSEAIVVIAGDGSGRADVQSVIASRAFPQDVRLPGRVEHSQMHWYYAACDVFAYPSRIDRPWLAVLEAQACGRPVVTMQTRSATLTVDPGRSGLLASDLDEFGRQIAALACDRKRAERMGREAMEYTARNHTLDVRIDQIDRLLRGMNDEQ